VTDRAAERYRRWFRYEEESHARVLASLEAVPPDLPGRPLQKAVDLLAHVVAARMLWLSRLAPGVQRPAEIFPRDVRLSELARSITAMQTAWSEYLARLDAAELERVFQYRSLEGAEFRSSVEDVLTQLFGHSLYHRGQIAALVRSMGSQPAMTDFIFWAREPVA
jgi:uncharacterized damage-inducible protein DinB